MRLITWLVNSMGSGTMVHRDIRSKIQWWLRAGFNAEFNIISSTQLPSGHQYDQVSCGVCVANVAAHALLGDVPWSQEKASLERVRWLDRIVVWQAEVSCYSGTAAES